MALKYELQQWGAAVEAYDRKDFEKAIETFETIADSAKFYFNVGLIYATLGEHIAACEAYERSVKLDTYFAVAYFQKGVSHFLLFEFEDALGCFNDAFSRLRSNMLIDYEQLGLKFRLYSCEVLFNRGLCYLYLGQTERGMEDLAYAAKEKQTEEHDVIDEAIQARGQGFTVFSIPVGIIYRPPEGKLKNVKIKDYLGKAKLVAAVDPSDAFTGFTGAQKKQTAQLNTTTPVSNDKSDGKVDPTLPRPRSLSTNPKQPPFPVRAGLSRSQTLNPNGNNLQSTSYGGTGFIAPLAINDKRVPSPNPSSGRNSPSPLQYQNSIKNSSQSNPDRFPYLPLKSDLRAHQRANTIDSGRPSPRLPPQRQNSLRTNQSKPNTDQSPRRPPPQEQKVNAQMSKMAISDTREYFEGLEYIINGDLDSIINSEENENYSSSNGRNNVRSPGPAAAKVSAFKSSPLRDNGLLTPPTPEQNELSGQSYASLIFGKDDDYQYGDEEDAQFEMLSPPNSRRKLTPQKIKIKCHYNDTRVILVPATIPFSDLIQRVQEKFSTRKGIKIKYKDEDGEQVMMTDQEDLEMAIGMITNIVEDTGRMEIWVVD